MENLAMSTLNISSPVLLFWELSKSFQKSCYRSDGFLENLRKQVVKGVSINHVTEEGLGLQRVNKGWVRVFKWLGDWPKLHMEEGGIHKPCGQWTWQEGGGYQMFILLRTVRKLSWQTFFFTFFCQIFFI